MSALGSPIAAASELSDPFLFDGGSRVRTREDWRLRRDEILALIQREEYGTLPPPPGNVAGVEILRQAAKFDPKVQHRQFKITCDTPEQPVSFLLDLHTPAGCSGDAPAPVIIRGDWCWRDVADEVLREVVGRGYALAEYNRCELAPDNPSRKVGLYLAYPDGDFGSVAAWAWGFHRCVDFLVTLPETDRTKIAVTGHSRGGKAALLAGATDERIALTAPNNSGCGGAGSHKHQPADAESVEQITRRFPMWFANRFASYAGKQDRLPFDQHFVKALVAPRALLTTEGLGDRWANPEGTRKTHEAAQEVYRFLGVADRIGIHYREGGHAHSPDDWRTLLDFADQIFFDKTPQTPRDFDANPFPHLPRMYAWTAPPVEG